jgi:recombination protein RecR
MNKAIPASVIRLIEEFSRLPSVGSKTASRLTYYLLRAPSEQAQSLADALIDLRTRTRYCSICFNITEDDPCPICSDETREQATICVVEEPLDVLAIERTGSYKGRYHVLHGAISPVEGIGPDELRIRDLFARLEREPHIREIILATNLGIEGDATAMYIHSRLDPDRVKVTRLARGMPAGGDLEYTDSITLSRALEGRNEM